LSSGDRKYTFKSKLSHKDGIAIKAMLKEADKEFIPPLSSRHSTTESDLSGKYVSEKGIEEYYEKIKNQSVLLCRENGKIVGFMSFILNHSVTVNDSRIDCLYLSTLIVSENHRRKHIAREMYDKLLKKYGKKTNIITRTWSTNKEHTSLLHRLGFALLESITDDRGQGIDTVYYGKMLHIRKKLSFFEKLKAYHLTPNFFIMLILIGLSIGAFFIYFFVKGVSESGLWSNLFIALFTGFFVSILDMAAGIFIEIKNNERGEALEDIYSFGIEDLSTKKGDVLLEQLTSCKKEIWISGYRLILTNRLRDMFALPVEKGANCKVIVCPPWTDAFKLVYGEDKVIGNYFEVFNALHKASLESGAEVKVYFVAKPLFSDTYKIDDKLISGPYLHNRDEKYNRIMASDFFTYIVGKDKPLYSLLEKEFATLESEVVWEINWEKFEHAYEKYAEAAAAIAEEERIEIFMKAIEKVEDYDEE